MKGYIYIIICNDDNIKDFYIGSTTNIISRKKQHKSPNSKAYNNILYDFIRNNGGFQNFQFKTIKEVEIENKSDLSRIENEQIELLNPTLNSNNLSVDMKEYQKEYYKTKYKDYHKIRYQEKMTEYKDRNNKRYALIKTLLENYKNT